MARPLRSRTRPAPSLSPMPVVALTFVLACAFALLPSPAARALKAELGPFLGTYVGSAQVYGEAGNLEGERDMTIEIVEGPKDGFTITWINVSLIDGRRDVPGVERRVATATFVPAERDGVYIEEMRGSLFERRHLADPLAGEPMRWARVDGDRLGVFSFGILENGRYGLQSYERILTDVGLDIEFRAVLDGQVVRTITGHTVRVD